MKKNQYMLAAAILAGGLIFVSTGQAQQQPGKVGPGKGQAKPGQGQARPGQGQRPGRGQARPGQGQRPGRGQFQPGQGRRPGGGFGGFRGRNSYEGIGLTEEQQKKITAIQEEQRAEFGKLIQELRDGGGDRQAFGAKMTALREKYQKQSDAVLTDEQKKKMAEARAQRPQGGRDQGQPRSRNPFASLNLTEEQQKKVTELQAKQRTERIELYRNAGRDREGLNEKRAVLSEKHKKQIEALLTDEQKKKYKELQAQRPQRRPAGGSTRPGGGRPRPDGKSKERPKRSDA